MVTPAWSQILSIFCLVLYTVELTLKLAGGFGVWGQKVNLFIILTGYLEIILSVPEAPSVLLSALRAVRCVRTIKLLASLRDAGLSSLTHLEDIMMLCMKDSVGEVPNYPLIRGRINICKNIIPGSRYSVCDLHRHPRCWTAHGWSA